KDLPEGALTLLADFQVPDMGGGLVRAGVFAMRPFTIGSATAALPRHTPCPISSRPATPTSPTKGQDPGTARKTWRLSMRTTADRIRHAISFELIGILIATPLAAFAFHLEGGDSVVIVVGSATVAMVWNYIYNLGFDHLMNHFRGTTEKTKPI